MRKQLIFPGEAARGRQRRRRSLRVHDGRHGDWPVLELGRHEVTEQVPGDHGDNFEGEATNFVRTSPFPECPCWARRLRWA